MRQKKVTLFFLKKSLNEIQRDGVTSDRKKEFIRIILMCAPALILGFVFRVSGVRAASSQPDYLQKVETAVLSSTTKKIQYRYGKIKTKYDASWKKAARLTKNATSLRIRKKGWYTFRVKTNAGKYKLFGIKLKKKKYAIRANTPLRKTPGFYYISLKSVEGQVAEVRDSSLSEKAVISPGAKGERTGQVWALEAAGGKKFRLKNVNSGLYLGCGKATGNTKIVQKKRNGSDANQIFECMFAGGSYVYLKNRGTKEYLCVSGKKLVGTARKKNKAWKFRLENTEEPKPKVSVSSAATFPTQLLPGSPFAIKGVVESNYTIVSLTASVVNSKGEAVLAKTVAPGSCTYDLSGVDSALTFGRLPAGTYRYRVVLSDSAGHQLTAFDREFRVCAASAAPGHSLVYNASLITAVGCQSAGDALEKKACASYALAYCNAILGGRAVNPRSYWVSATNVDCDWSKGGYTTAAYSSEQEVLQAAYAQIAAGRPCILHVYSDTSSQHWLTLTGYQNVAGTLSLSAANFVAIDPWDGAVITVSDKYRVKTTYRLAYKAG